MTNTKKQTPSRKNEDSSGLSRNHSKDVKYRKRVQEEKEAEQEIKEYGEDDQEHPRVY